MAKSKPVNKDTPKFSSFKPKGKNPTAEVKLGNHRVTKRNENFLFFNIKGHEHFKVCREEKILGKKSKAVASTGLYTAKPTTRRLPRYHTRLTHP